MPEGFHVFLSYNSQDRAAVEEIGECLWARELDGQVRKQALLPAPE